MNIKRFIFNIFMENTYVVYTDEGDTMVVDPGCSNATEYARLKSFLIENKLKLKFVVNTHAHIDHVFGDSFLEKEFGVRPFVNQADDFLINDLKGQAYMFGMPSFPEIPTIGKYIKEGDSIKLGSEEFVVYEIPGHSPGGIAFYNAKNSCIFTGDVLFENSIGRTDLPQGDYDTLIEGITKKLLTLPDDTVVYCGHGPYTTIGDEKETNPFI